MPPYSLAIWLNELADFNENRQRNCAFTMRHSRLHLLLAIQSKELSGGKEAELLRNPVLK
jgi:hypothetical protein